MGSIQATDSVLAVTGHVDDGCVLQQYNTTWYTNSYNTNFDVLLAVHLSIILVINQPNAQIPVL